MGTHDASRSGEEDTIELVARLRDGDQSAGDKLLTRSLPPLRRWAHGRLPAWARDSSDTSDLVQETALQALTRMNNFEPRHAGALQAYLRQAVMTRIRDIVRKAQRRPTPTAMYDSLAALDPSPLEQAVGAEQAARYEDALARLAPRDRELIVARVELGQTFEEVAVALELPTAAAARIAVSRALIRLAQHMA